MQANFNKWKEKFIHFPRWKQILCGIGAMCVLLFFLLLFLYLSVTWELVDNIPGKKDLKALENPLASQLYDREGTLLGKYYIENRAQLKVEDLNDFYKNALIATEDIRFYKHSGVDYRSLFRVFFKTLLLQKDASGGGSTISQQLAKNLYPRKRYKIFSTLVNKFREMELARRLEKTFSKEEILMMYSNTVSFGERAFGLHTASYRFFNKEPKELLLEEAATLVGILKATSYYSPRRYGERAQNRRNVVLQQMAKYDYISKETYDELASFPLTLDYQPPSENQDKAKYYKEEVRKEFEAWATTISKPDGSKYNLFTDGLKVYGTLDYNLQKEAEKRVQKHMQILQKTFLESWNGGKMYGKNNVVIDDHITSDPYYKSLRAAGKNGKEALSYFTKQEVRETWTWSGNASKSITKIDSIKHYLGLLHTGLMAVKPSSGEILAYVGGNDFDRFQYDNIKGARQVGSTFKPIVYLAAIEAGSYPCDYYDNELRTYSDYKDWTPRNADDNYGGKASMRGALTYSMNAISVQILFNVGIPAVIKLAERLGIKSPLNKVPSIVLGTSDVSLFEMMGVYATFANRGKRIPLKAIMTIEDNKGNVLYEKQEERGTQVIEKEEMDILNEMLLNVTVKGTGRKIYRNYRIPYPIGGKTGTTQNQSDGWYIGCNEDLAIGAWVGTQDRRIHFRNLGTGSGGATALPMVGALYEYAGNKGYLKKRRLAFEPLEECDDIIPDYEDINDQIADAEREMDNIKDDILGDYRKSRRFGSNKNNRRKRDSEKDKRYREYKKAVKDLEDKLAILNEALKRMENQD